MDITKQLSLIVGCALMKLLFHCIAYLINRFQRRAKLFILASTLDGISTNCVIQWFVINKSRINKTIIINVPKHKTLGYV